VEEEEPLIALEIGVRHSVGRMPVPASQPTLVPTHRASNRDRADYWGRRDAIGAR